MFPKQRAALDEIVTKMRTGRMSRRTFLERAWAIGIATPSALALLESCGGSHPSTYLVWQSEYDLSGTYQKLVSLFNEKHPDIQVVLQMGQPGTNDLATIERNMLQIGSSAADIFSIDIINVAEFASRRTWLQPISENLWPASERAKYLPGPMAACTFDGQVWAVPFRADVGLIYYRTDLVHRPPSSWEELTEIAHTVMSQNRQMKGYVWEGAQYEGLVCNFDEVLHGYGGSLFEDPYNPLKVTVYSQEAMQALETMVNWIHPPNISPPDITTYTEEVTRQSWENGSAVFMRNWPYVYEDAKKLPSPGHFDIADHFDIHPMLPGGKNKTGHSSVGGWQLAINASSSPERRNAAWEFIQFVLQPEAQKIGATMASWVMTLQSIYTDQEVLSRVPLYKHLQPILQTAVPRPVTPKYAAISADILLHVRQALVGKMTSKEALKALAENLRAIINKSPSAIT